MAKYRGVTYRAKKNLYEGRFQYCGESYSVYGQTAKEAADKLEELKHDVKHGLYCKPQEVTLDKWFQTWIEDKRNRGEIKETTAERYTTLYRNQIKDTLGRRRVSDITAAALRKLITSIAVEGKWQTASLTYIVLLGLFKAAARDRMIMNDPMQIVEPPKKEKKDPEDMRVLSRKEQEIFTRYSDGVYHDFWMALLQTGTRINEMAALCWKDVNMERNEIRISHTLTYIRHKGRFLTPPKTKAGRRSIPILPEFKRILQRQRKNQLENRMALGSTYKVEKGLEDIVFQYPEGGALWSQSAYHDMERIVSKIQKDYPDFEPIHPHTLRHTFATRWIENGGDLKTLQTILGHSTFAITMDTYSHVLPDKKQEEMKRVMGGLFS